MNSNSKPSSVIREIDDALKDPAGQIQARSDELLGLFPPKQLDENLQHILGRLPSRLEHYGYKPFEAAGSAAGIARHFAETWKRGDEIGRRNTLMRLMRSYIIARPTIALEDREKGYLRSMAALRADGSVTEREFHAFLAEFCWCEGQCVLNPSLAATRDKLEPQARALLGQILQLHLRPYKQFLAATAALIAANRANGQASGQTITAFLNQGSAWAEPEVGTSSTYGLEQTSPSLIIGFTRQNQRPVYYDGDESLITIAGPGTGKSQVQVIPNLICYPGSAFVLDVKGELWNATAGHRARHYGPVYRFAPSDPNGHTHRYNPFDFVSGDPQQAAVDCELISTQIIPPNSASKDPFWDNRGRDFLWTFALATALSESPDRRNLATVMEMLAIPVNFIDGMNDPAYEQSPTPVLLARLKELAVKFHIPALAQTAVAVESGLNDRTDGVFDAARRYLTIFSRSGRLRQAMASSDWSPIDLRRQPGTTVYLCLSGDDIDTYKPIVRLVLQQHANLLLSSPRHAGMPPITFFLDEFPQLGRMESIQRLLDVGRGAGLRLWLFAPVHGPAQRDLWAARGRPD